VARNSSCRSALTEYLEFRRNRSESTAQKTSQPNILTKGAVHEYIRNPSRPVGLVEARWGYHYSAGPELYSMWRSLSRISAGSCRGGHCVPTESVLSVVHPEGAMPWTCAGTRTVKRSHLVADSCRSYPHGSCMMKYTLSSFGGLSRAITVCVRVRQPTECD
jgi:hypothetical protein